MREALVVEAPTLHPTFSLVPLPSPREIAKVPSRLEPAVAKPWANDSQGELFQTEAIPLLESPRSSGTITIIV